MISAITPMVWYVVYVVMLRVASCCVLQAVTMNTIIMNTIITR